VLADVSAGLEVCIGALSASDWETRNAASLCFTALVVRTLGFKNLAKVRGSKEKRPFLRAAPQTHDAQTMARATETRLRV
jgi:hypothetical protein